MKNYRTFSLKFLLVLTLIAAVAMKFYSNKPESLEEIDHVRILSKTDSSYQFHFEKEVTRKQTDQVLDLLEAGGDIWFFDLKLTLSDPGIYVTLRKLSEDEFTVSCGNHGWTRDKFVITRDEAYEYFWISHDDNLVDQTDWWYTKMRFNATGKVPTEFSRGDNPIYKHIRKLIKDQE